MDMSHYTLCRREAAEWMIDMGKKFPVIVLVLELILLAAMLLADFGVINSAVDPLSRKSILLHISVVILIIGSAVGVLRSKKK